MIHRHAHLDAVTVSVVQRVWDRITVDGKSHNHAFSSARCAHAPCELAAPTQDRHANPPVHLDRFLCPASLTAGRLLASRRDPVKHTCEVRQVRGGKAQITSGIMDLKLMKTTQSGFAGFIRDECVSSTRAGSAKLQPRKRSQPCAHHHHNQVH